MILTEDATEQPPEPACRPDAIITLVYTDASGNVIDSEQLSVVPEAGSVWIKPSETILSWPAVRTVRASLTRTPVTPVDINVYLLQPPGMCFRDDRGGHPDRF